MTNIEMKTISIFIQLSVIMAAIIMLSSVATICYDWYTGIHGSGVFIIKNITLYLMAPFFALIVQHPLHSHH